MFNPDRNPALIVVAGAVFFATAGYLGVGASNGTSQPAPVVVDNSAAADDPKAGGPTVDDHDPRRPFQEFLAQADVNAGKELAGELIRQLDEIEPQFLIATVPDPIDSRFGYRFDAILDDILMAIEGQGWNFDRFWLPWWPSGTQLTQRGQLKPVLNPSAPDPGRELLLHLPGFELSGSYGKPVGIREAADKSALHEREPGILLFRKARHPADPDQRQRLLVVFLVGERPTSGVHKLPLGRAFNVIESVTRRVEGSRQLPPGETPFDILGPYFSGSERSISATISQWLDRELTRDGPPASGKGRTYWHFDVLSGAATKVDAEQFVRDSGDDGHRPVKVEFHATVHDFDRVLDALFRFLQERNGGWALGKVALLTESDTEFGNSLFSGRASGKDDSGRKSGASITQMKYPFHISQVAVAIDRFRRDDPKAPPALSRSSSKLRIPFDETGTPRDIVPSLSPQTTAASDEFNMAKVLETISTEGFRYVGIIASDTRDTIFLSGLIEEYCPDVQIFTTTGDLLLGHPDYAGQLRGTVVASTYPLFSMAQRWDPPHRGDNRRHLFMHESDQGYYNAAVTLVGRRESARPEPWLGVDEKYFDFLYDYGRPFDEMDLAIPEPQPTPNYPDDFLPPVWLGVVGERGVWPVKFEVSKSAGFLLEDSLLRPGAEETPRLEFAGGPGVRRDLIDGKLIPLIPQFTWTWGALVVGLSVLVWRVSLAQWEVATGTAKAGGFSYRFRLMSGGDGGKGSPLFGSQEWAVAALLAALAAVYGFIVIYPCRLTIRHSPLGHFFGPVSRGRSPFAWGDYWNWQFGLIVTILCGACATALAATVALRLHQVAGSRNGSSFAYLVIALIVAGLALPAWAVLLPCIALAGCVALYWRPSPRPSGAPLVIIPLTLLLSTFTLGMMIDPPGGDVASGTLGAWGVGAVFVRWAEAVIMTSSAIAVLRLAGRPDARPRKDKRPSKWVRWLALGGVPLAAGASLLCVEVASGPPTGPYDSLLFLERAFSLGNGVTPVMPVLLLGLAAGGWSLCQLRRTGLADRFWRDRYADPKYDVPTFGLDRDPGMKAPALRRERILQAEQEVCKLLRSPIPGEMWKRPWSLVAMGLAAVFLLRMHERSIPTVDGAVFGRAMVLAFAFLVFATVVSLSRLLFVWSALQGVLREFAMLPMQRAFDRVPKSITREFGPYLNAIRPRLSHLERHARQWSRVASDYRPDYALKAIPCQPCCQEHLGELTRMICGEDPKPGKPGGRSTAPADRIMKAFEDECRKDLVSVELSTSKVRQGIRKAAVACLAVLLPYWNARRLDDGYGETRRGKEGAPPTPPPASSVPPQVSPDGFATWVDDAEDLIALEFLNFVGECTLHLKNLSQFLTVGPLLLLLAALSYPFEPGHFLVDCLCTLLLVVVAGVTWVYVGLERDEVLSRVANTSPDSISMNWTFMRQIVAVLIPLLGALLARFPFFSDTLNQWLGPIFGALI